jgi:hypothetical protein
MPVVNKSIIGKVSIPIKEDILTVSLFDDRTVECDKEDYKWLVDAQLSIYNREYSVGSGPYGDGFLNHLAKVYNGRAEIIPHKSEPGVIY